MMKFSDLALFFQKLENTSSRNMMTEVLAKLFKEAAPEEIDKICYLTQGRVAPLFTPLEFGMADKMMIKAISRAYDISEKKIAGELGKMGDMGKAAEKLANKASHSFENGVIARLPRRPSASLGTPRNDVGINDVFSLLKEIAKSTGSGSVEKKVRLLVGLLQKVDSLSARYIVRIPLAKMRLGFSDMTVLDGLSWMIGKSKEARKEIERAYNVYPDLGLIAKVIKEKGLKGTKEIGPEVGVPILMARAERLSSGKEIIDKIGKCAIEGKYDGFRIQVHYGRNLKSQNLKLKTITQNLKLFEDPKTLLTPPTVEVFVRLFSRNLEDVTNMYPDIAEGVVHEIKADEAIFEGEAIGWDEKNKRYLPFQETVQRKRKYDIAAMSKSVPLRLIIFDLLYLNGENLLEKSFLERRKRLEKVI